MSARPVVATPRTNAAVAGTFYVAGGLAALAVVVLADWSRTRAPGSLDVLAAGVHPRVVVTVIGLCGLLGGPVLLRVGPRLPPWAFHLVIGAGTCLVSLGVAVAPTTAGAVATSTVYVFSLVDSVVLFPPRAAAGQIALLLGQAALVLGPRPVGWGPCVSLVLTGTAIGVVTNRLVRLASDATRDPLTGLANRRGLDTTLDAVVASSRRTGEPLSAALLDVDHFKAVNDTAGHHAGDDLLRRVAEDARGVLPEGTFLCRFGGDEFAVLMPGVPGDRALALLEAVRTGSRTRLSGGVAQLLPGESGAELLRRVDTALYAAKAAGRDRCHLGDHEGVGLADDLAQALRDGDVRAWFQPVVSSTDGTLWGVEALARWHHPERGQISPADFVPVAEATGLIDDLGAAVLADACREAVALRSRLGQDLHLTVNVSGRELTAPGYPQHLLRVLDRHGWPARLTVVEVTESLVDASTGVGLAALDDLRAAGVRIAVDDFGTGWSSFSRLDVVPADLLKLDAAFTADITTSDRRRGMLVALLGLGESLRLQVVAEGVETAEQAALLRRLGCPLSQGWFHARPVPPAELGPAPGRPGWGVRGPAGRDAAQSAVVGR